MPNIASPENLEAAVVQLSRSEKGRRAVRDLLAFLENGAISLDDENQQQVLTLLSGVWGSYAGTTLELLRDVAEQQDRSVPTGMAVAS